MSTRRPQASDHEAGPVRVDGTLRQTVALLELVRQEEALLGRLAECAAQLQAVHRARQTLLDATDAELAEAEQLATHPGATFPGTGRAEEVGS